MSITNGYTSLNVYKQRFYDEGMGDTKDDSTIEAIIEATSREIDDICWQRFFTTSANETRYFTADRRYKLMLPDRIVSIGTLKTDNDNDRTYENSWTLNTDYDLMPYNAALDGVPYSWIAVTPNGNYTFPAGIAKGVEISGKFGWATVPPQIREACLLGAHRTMKRLTTPLGVSGAAALGQLSIQIPKLRSDPDFMMFLQWFIRVV